MSPRICLVAPLLLSLAANAWPQEESKTIARAYYKRGFEHAQARESTLAIAFLTEALELDPRHTDAYFVRALLYANHGKYEEAISDWTSILAFKPGDDRALLERGMCHVRFGRYDLAISDLTALIDSPTPQQIYRCAAYHYRGRAYRMHHNDNAKAIADFTEALLIRSDDFVIRWRRAQAYHDLQEYEQAHHDFESLELHLKDAARYGVIPDLPDFPDLVMTWAWQLATCPDKAYRDGGKSHKLTLELAMAFGGLSKRPRYLDVLAAALAECGRFSDAVETIDSAIVLLGDKDRELKQAMTKRRELYADDQPFREQPVATAH